MVVSSNDRTYNRKWFINFLFSVLLTLNFFIFLASIGLFICIHFNLASDQAYFYHVVITIGLNLITIIISLIYWYIRSRKKRDLCINNPVIKDTYYESSSTGEEDDLCLICQRHLDPEKGEIILTSCCHNNLHAECQVQWLIKQDLCPFPYCNQTIIN